MITVEELKTLLEYNSETGLLTWKVSRGPKAKGSTAGYRHHTGYIQLEIKGKAYLAHRIAWALFYNEWPRDRKSTRLNSSH